MDIKFSPGCALKIYKPNLSDQVLEWLNNEIGEVTEHELCCRHDPQIDDETQIINVCAGCDKRFRTLYEKTSTKSLWEILAESKSFVFPDYYGLKMTVHDACPTRTEDRVHDAIRKLLARMNIEVIEPNKTKRKAVCCGDTFYGEIPKDKVKEKMTQRADEMPCEDVVVYCVSCIKAMHIGDKTPRYMVDLLFGETTEIGEYDPDLWHTTLQEYIDAH